MLLDLSSSLHSALCTILCTLHSARPSDDSRESTESSPSRVDNVNGEREPERVRVRVSSCSCSYGAGDMD